MQLVKKLNRVWFETASFTTPAGEVSLASPVLNSYKPAQMITVGQTICTVASIEQVHAIINSTIGRARDSAITDASVGLNGKKNKNIR